jgi:hypothetical protein
MAINKKVLICLPIKTPKNPTLNCKKEKWRERERERESSTE